MFVICPHCKAKIKIDHQTEIGTELTCPECGKPFQHKKDLIHIEQIKMHCPRVKVLDEGFMIDEAQFRFDDLHIVTFDSVKDQKSTHTYFMIFTWGVTLVGLMFITVMLIAYFNRGMEIDIATIIYMIIAFLMAVVFGPISVRGTWERIQLNQLDPDKVYEFRILSKSQGHVYFTFKDGVDIKVLTEIEERVVRRLLEQQANPATSS